MISDVRSFPYPAFAKLIIETWKAAPESVAEVHAGRKKSKA
jgi:hypothetical protein